MSHIILEAVSALAVGILLELFKAWLASKNASKKRKKKRHS